MAEQFLSSLTDPTASVSFDPSALLTTSTINALHFPGMAASGTSDSGGGGNRTTSFLFLDGVGMCESMSESFCSTMGAADDVTLINGFPPESSSNVALRSLEKKDSATKSINAQKKRRSRKAQYDASMDGPSLDRIESVNIADEQDEPDDAWLFRASRNGHSSNDPTSNNIYSWVHKEFQANDINANKHRLLCKLDDMSHARTIRSVSCHNFAAATGSDMVKRSSTEQQVNPAEDLYSENLLENALYITELFTYMSSSKLRLSTLSLDSIDRDDEVPYFLYDSLNDDDESSDDDDDEEFHDCLNETNLLRTLVNERQCIERLTRQYSSMDSLDDAIAPSKPIINGRMISPMRTTSITPVHNINGNTRPTSPDSSSPHRYNIATTSASINYANNNPTVRSRDVSRERERLDYTDLEVLAKVQLENLRQAERQGPLSKRFGGSSNTLLSTDSRDPSPVSVFGGTRNTSPVHGGGGGRMTPRRSYSPSPAATGIPVRKNSFNVTESQYAHVLPSVSPRSASPAVLSSSTGQWSGRATPSLLETCMETSFTTSIQDSQSSSLLTNAVNPFASTSSAPGGSNLSLASTSSGTSVSMSNRGGTKPPVAPKSLVARNGTKPNNYRRSNTQTITPTSGINGFDVPVVSDPAKPQPTSTTNRVSLLPSNSATNTRTRPPTARPLQAYRGSQTNYNNSNAKMPPPAPSSVQRNGGRKTGMNDLENGLLNDVSNKPLVAPVRAQVAPQRRAVLPQSSTHSSVEQIPPGSSIDTTTNESTSIPRSASSLSQGRKSGIPTIGKPQRPSIPTLTRPSSSNPIPSSQSSDSMMVTRTISSQKSSGAPARPQIPDNMSPTTSWNEGCY